MHRVKVHPSQRVQLFMTAIGLYFGKARFKQKFIHEKMLDGSVVSGENTTKWTKNAQKCSKQRETWHIFNFVTTTVLSRHL